jgi:hypothetical protein
MSKFDDKLNDANAKALVDLLFDQDTPDNTQMNIIHHLISSRAGQDFFKTIFEENLSFGKCPKCEHENHWIIPEDSLNKTGYVTSERDPRVLEKTDDTICKDFKEACKKKKVMI